MQLEQVVLIGAGNVAWHLGKRLQQNGIRIAQVYSRHLPNAQRLAKGLDCPATDRLATVLPLNDCLYLIAVRDDAIVPVAEQLSFLSDQNRIFAHTSGAAASSTLANYFAHYGVFYPLQTLSRDRKVDFSKIPVCVYSPERMVVELLVALGARISKQVAEVNDHQRQVLHVSAVFVNNFSNHLFSIGSTLVEKEGLSFDLLRPLIEETALKIMKNAPESMQTGPARRNDQSTILTHLRYLQQYPSFQDIYRMISHSIGKQCHSADNK